MSVDLFVLVLSVPPLSREKGAFGGFSHAASRVATGNLDREVEVSIVATDAEEISVGRRYSVLPT